MMDGLNPKAAVTLFSFKLNARGASLQPVPGLVHLRTSEAGLKSLKPGS